MSSDTSSERSQSTPCECSLGWHSGSAGLELTSGEPVGHMHGAHATQSANALPRSSHLSCSGFACDAGWFASLLFRAQSRQDVAC